MLNEYFIVEKVVPSISLQSKIDLLTAKPPSYDKRETLTDLNPGQEDWKLPSSDLISKNLPELRESQNLSKPPLGMAEEIRLHNVMEKAQNMPLEYDASRARRRQNWNDQIILNEDYIKPTSRSRENWNNQGSNIVNKDYMKPTVHLRENWNGQGSGSNIVNEDYMKPTAGPRENWNDQGSNIVNEDYVKPTSRPRENWNDQGSNIVNEDYMKPTSYPKENWNDQGNKIDIVNEGYMKPAASEERLEKIPMEISALLRSPPTEDVSDKEKFKSSVFPQFTQPPYKQPFMP